MTLVADTSALVSLAATSDARRVALPLFLDGSDVAVPRHVTDELGEMAGYEDAHATAGGAVLDERDRLDIHDVELDPEFPLDDGENTAIQLATEIDAAFFYCDEYNRLVLIHASLSDSRLVTTPRVLDAFVAHGDLSKPEARDRFEGISQVHNWDENAYAQQAARLSD